MTRSPRIAKFFSLKKFLALNLITIISWQSLAYGANIGISLIYAYIIAIILYHIPNLLLTNYLVDYSTKNQLGNNAIIHIVHTRLNYCFNVLLVLATWLANVFGYPATFAFILSNLFYAFNYNLSSSQYFIGVISLYLVMSNINLRGFTVSFKFILLFCLLGIVLPMAIMIGYFIFYMLNHQALLWHWLIHMQLAHPFSLKNLNCGFILAIIMTVIGFEQSSLHLDQMLKNKFYFKHSHLALASLAMLCFTFFMLLILAYITTVEQIDPNYLIAGTISKFFTLMQLPFLIKPCVILFALGEFGCVFAWMVHINRTFGATALLRKKARSKPQSINSQIVYDAPHDPGNIDHRELGINKKIIKFELLVFLLYYILLKIFPALETSQILYNLSAQLSILYYVILYLAVMKIPNMSMKLRLVFILGVVTSLIGLIFSLIPNASL